MNFKKKILTIFLALVLLVPSFGYRAGAASDQPSSYSKSSNSGTRGVVCTTLDGTSASSYYTGNYTYDKLDDLSGDQLKSTLKNLMKSTHSHISSYDDCHYKADKTDCEEGNGRVTLIYTSYSATMSQWNGWNREHVWPKSLGGDNTSGGGADLHHIRPSDATVNSTRGNKKYGNVNGGKEVKGSNPANGVLGGYSGTYFEPLDNVKGDVARICLYVYVRWGSEWRADSITKVFESVDVLLEWCALDPVDTWEMGRNEVVQNYQGNRNVFIDYPELAWEMFDKEMPANMTTPSGKAAQGGGSSGSTTTGCQHENTTLRGYVAGNCGNDGYSGDKYCRSCNRLVEAGSVVKATGNHTYGDWNVTKQPSHTEAGSKTRRCTTCGYSDTEAIPKLQPADTTTKPPVTTDPPITSEDTTVNDPPITDDTTFDEVTDSDTVTETEPSDTSDNITETETETETDNDTETDTETESDSDVATTSPTDSSEEQSTTQSPATDSKGEADKNNNGGIVIIVVSVVALAVIVTVVIVYSRKKNT